MSCEGLRDAGMVMMNHTAGVRASAQYTQDRARQPEAMKHGRQHYCRSITRDAVPAKSARTKLSNVTPSKQKSTRKKLFSEGLHALLTVAIKNASELRRDDDGAESCRTIPPATGKLYNFRAAKTAPLCTEFIRSYHKDESFTERIYSRARPPMEPWRYTIPHHIHAWRCTINTHGLALQTRMALHYVDPSRQCYTQTPLLRPQRET